MSEEQVERGSSRDPDRSSARDADQLDVLVVDDDPAMRELLAEIIQRQGHRAVVVDAAEKGLELLPHWTFQVAFLDHNLPGMQGVILAEYLRRSNPDMILALVTGEDNPKLERKARELKVVFIAKPFEVARIARVLDSYVEQAKERAGERARREAPDYEPPIGRYAGELRECFGIPKVPDRVADRVASTVQRCLHNLRSASRYTERDRVVALSGLLAAKLLGVDLPTTSEGLSLYEEYDRLMQEHGRRTEFGAA
ncbi:MAG: response regulator [Sandaracinaceae bacterium]|nr:response regulator [Sandaracinaceae bacterium]